MHPDNNTTELDTAILALRDHNISSGHQYTYDCPICRGLTTDISRLRFDEQSRAALEMPLSERKVVKPHQSFSL